MEYLIVPTWNIISLLRAFHYRALDQGSERLSWKMFGKVTPK